jgi:hypothetical protein
MGRWSKVLIALAAGLLLLAVGFAAGFARGHSQVELDNTAGVAQPTFAQLDAGISVATGMAIDQVHALPGYGRTRLPDCGGKPSCLRVYVEVPGTDGRPLQQRLAQAGWTLVPDQEPECVSDNPYVFGWTCSYERGQVIVSVQVEQPVKSSVLSVWATSD